jgi:hypothetical protein
MGCEWRPGRRGRLGAGGDRQGHGRGRACRRARRACQHPTRGQRPGAGLLRAQVIPGRIRVRPFGDSGRIGGRGWAAWLPPPGRPGGCWPAAAGGSRAAAGRSEGPRSALDASRRAAWDLAGRPRQRLVRGRVQGPGRGAEGEAVPTCELSQAQPDSVTRLPSTESARLVLGDGLVRRSAMARCMRFRSTMRPSLDGAGRVLQQLTDLLRALGEMVCVTRPCSRVVGADLDQESLVIEVPGRSRRLTGK